ncbi:uncharacterized protein DC041_0006360, partial [Schistosoma bovis]
MRANMDVLESKEEVLLLLLLWRRTRGTGVTYDEVDDTDRVEADVFAGVPDMQLVETTNYGLVYRVELTDEADALARDT